MTFEEGILVFFGLTSILAAAGIVLVKDVIRAAVLLVVVLLSLAAIYALLKADLLAVVQVLVYAGGIVVLLAFGIMLTKRAKTGKLLSGRQLVLPATLVAGFFLFLLVKMLVNLNIIQTPPKAFAYTISEIGIAFMTEYLLAFELIAFILLVVLVGATFIAQKSADIDGND